MKKILNLIIFSFFAIILVILKRENLVMTYGDFDKNLDDDSFRKLVKSLSENTYLNANRKMVFLKLVQQKQTKKKKKNKNQYNMDTMINILYQFLQSTGVSCDIYNWNGQHLVIITKVENFIDRDAILDRFKGFISEVGEHLARDLYDNMTGKKRQEL